MDIIEIDAASNNGVDEIRELRNNVSLVPSDLKYKVYIIDEVHMLSIGAFNALLKTLEEPPEHVIFILATTESQKVPETIVSRCQCYSFKRISNNNIIKKLKEIVNIENIKIEDQVLENIAIQSDGGMRDALSLLDKLHSYNSTKITLNDFIDVNGIVSHSELEKFLKSIIEGNEIEVINSLNDFNNNGKNLVQIMIQLLNYCRDLLVDIILNDFDSNYSFDLLQQFANMLNEKINDIKKASNTKIYIEMMLLNYIINIKKTTNVEENTKIIENKKIEETEVKNTNNDKISEVKDPVSITEEKNDVQLDKELSLITNIDEIMDIRINNTLALADKECLKKEKNLFDKLNNYTFDQKIGYLVCNLLDSKLRVASNENIIISYDLESTVEENIKQITLLNDTYNKITNSNKKIAIVSDKKWEKLKKEYIEKRNNKSKYEILEEPEEILEDFTKNDIISSSAIDLFGEVVEFE